MNRDLKKYLTLLKTCFLFYEKQLLFICWCAFYILYTRNFSKAFSATFTNSRRPKFMSNILRFPDSVPKEKKLQNVSLSKSFKFMISQGYIKSVSPGIFSLMPLAIRSLEKLCFLVDQLMITIDAQKVLFPSLIQDSLLKFNEHSENKADDINAQKVLLPGLIQDSLLKTSGHWKNDADLFKLQDRNKSTYFLAPTHEEIATQLLSKLPISYKALPLKLYQISTKFRDEMNPKLGFLRGREFVMKDMYSFDSTEENAEITYQAVIEVYHKLFKLLGVDVVQVKAENGKIGGLSSYEFHIISDVGEDEIFYCPKCKNGINLELFKQNKDVEPICVTCNSNYQKSSAIEVGHVFLLGTKYSEPFLAKYDTSSKTKEYLHMGSYGLGITRIIAASIEHLSTPDNIKWPLLIAPYLLFVIIPKKESKEEPVLPFADHLSISLNSIDWLASNVVVDDRTNLTIGKRVREARELGIPYIAVVGSSAMEEIPKVEVIDVYNSETFYLTHKETMDFFRWKRKELMLDN